MYINRTIESAIMEVSRSFPCVVVYGPRQVGKSTTVDHLFGDKYRKVTLDNLDDRSLAISDPRLFLETYQWPLIIDEIQKALKLIDEIKILIDEQRLKWLKTGEDRRLMYILTGSNQFELQQGVSDSLAGRCGILDMASLSNVEKRGAASLPFTADYTELLKRERDSDIKYRSKREIFDDIFQGGMPDICTGVSAREAYFKSYIGTYIEKDVKQLIAATSEMQFRNFLSIIALRTAQELHYDVIANSVGIDVRTCKKWLSILETSGVIFLLQPYMSNISHRIIKAPKLYFMDTGLCAYLCKWPNSEMLEKGAMGGAFFETYVVSEIIKNHYSFNLDPKESLFYYRDTNQKEIDLLSVDRTDIYPIEIKKSSSPKNPTKNFSVLKKYGLNIQKGLVIDCCDRIRPVNSDAYYFPAYLLGV